MLSAFCIEGGGTPDPEAGRMSIYPMAVACAENGASVEVSYAC